MSLMEIVEMESTINFCGAINERDLILLDESFDDVIMDNTSAWESVMYINVKTHGALDALRDFINLLPVHSSISDVKSVGIYMYDELRGKFVSVTEEFMRIKNAFITIKRKS